MSGPTTSFHDIPVGVLEDLVRQPVLTEEVVRRIVPDEYGPLVPEILEKMGGTPPSPGGAHAAGAEAVGAGGVGVEPVGAHGAGAGGVGARAAGAGADPTAAKAPDRSAGPAAATQNPSETREARETREMQPPQHAAAASDSAKAEPTQGEIWAEMIRKSQVREGFDESKVKREDVLTGIFQKNFAAFELGDTSPHGTLTAQILDSHDAQENLEMGQPDSYRIGLQWHFDDVRPGEWVGYRVLATDYEAETSPESGELLVFTAGTAWIDEVTPTAGLRHYQVWASIGADPADAVLHQPILVGEEIVIFAPRKIQITESQGVVTGTWEPLKDHVSIKVYAAPENAPGRLTDPTNVIDEQERRFTQEAPVKGHTMRYELVPQVWFKGSLRAADSGTIVSCSVGATLERVELISVEKLESDRGDQIRVMYYAPAAGRVRIYKTQKPVNSDFEWEQAIPIERLEDEECFYGALHETFEEAPEGTTRESSFQWPEGWTSVYITPVTIVDRQAAVGTTRVLQRVEPIDNPQLVERVEGQLLTFEWPKGAALVRIRTSDNQSIDLSEEDYRRQGGIRLNLNRIGSEVELTPCNHYGKTETCAPSSIIRYRGLARYCYNLDYKMIQGVPVIELFLWRADSVDQRPPAFTLVCNTERLPLTASDGLQLAVTNTFQQYGGRGDVVIRPGHLFSTEREARAAADRGEEGRWEVDARQINAAFRGPTSGFLRLFITQPYQEVRGAQGAQQDMQGAPGMQSAQDMPGAPGMQGAQYLGGRRDPAGDPYDEESYGYSDDQLLAPKKVVIDNPAAQRLRFSTIGPA